MILSKLDSIGMIACPGARKFCNRVLKHLNQYIIREDEENLTSLSLNHSLSRGEIEARLLLINDMMGESYDASSSTKRSEKDFYVPTRFIKFANGEFKSQIMTSIRGRDIYIFQDPFNQYPLSMEEGGDPKEILSVNDHIILLLTVIDSCSHAGAKTINLVIPSYPYSRQDKRTGREGLTAALLSRMLEDTGVNLIITLDIHSKAIENSFRSLKMENLLPTYQICKALRSFHSLKDPDLVMVSPDTGAIDRNKYYASNLKRPLAFLYKERDYSRISLNAKESNIVSHKLLGEVKGKNVFMADDMLGTGGTMIEAMKHLKDMGAKDIYIAVSLPLFSGNAIENFQEAFENGYFHRLIGTDSIYHSEDLYGREWYVEAGVSKLFAEAIWRIHHNIGMASLLDSSLQIQKLISKEEGI